MSILVAGPQVKPWWDDAWEGDFRGVEDDMHGR